MGDKDKDKEKQKQKQKAKAKQKPKENQNLADRVPRSTASALPTKSWVVESATTPKYFGHRIDYGPVTSSKYFTRSMHLASPYPKYVTRNEISETGPRNRQMISKYPPPGCTGNFGHTNVNTDLFSRENYLKYLMNRSPNYAPYQRNASSLFRPTSNRNPWQKDPTMIPSSDAGYGLSNTPPPSRSRNSPTPGCSRSSPTPGCSRDNPPLNAFFRFSPTPSTSRANPTLSLFSRSSPTPGCSSRVSPTPGCSSRASPTPGCSSRVSPSVPGPSRASSTSSSNQRQGGAGGSRDNNAPSLPKFWRPWE